MGGEWSEITLSDLIDVKHGYAFPGEHIKDEPPGDVLLTPGNFAIGGGFKAEKFKYFDGEVPEEYILKGGDLIVTMTDLSKQADTLGYPALVPDQMQTRFLHNQRLGKVLIREGAQVDKLFLSYLLRTPEYRHEVLASATGTTVKHTSPSRILKFKSLFPPLPEQCAIAHILGTLDGKIELNRRMNETLESMARALFKSWFVDFEPVRAKVEGGDTGLHKEIADLFPDSFEDTALGEVPRGWKIQPLPDAIEVNPPCALRKGELAPYLDMANVPTNTARANQVVEREFGSGTKFKNGDTLVARITPCLENGKTAYVDFLRDDQVGWGSTEFIVLRPKPPLPPEFGYLLARDEGFRTFAISNMTGTSGRQRVPADCFNNYIMSIPPKSIAETFGQQVAVVMLRIKANDEESQILAAQRDTLLPKLLSGEVRVKDAERLIERSF